jgi:hypothetical protein
MLLPAIMPGTRLTQLFSNPSIRTAILAYALLTALVYFALLRNIGHDGEFILCAAGIGCRAWVYAWRNRTVPANAALPPRIAHLLRSTLTVTGPGRSKIETSPITRPRMMLPG